MSRSTRPLTVTLPLRKICAALPAVALMAAGIAVSAPGHSITSAAVSSDSPGIVVPDTALSLASAVMTPTDNLSRTLVQAPTRKGAEPARLMGAVLGASSVVTLDSSGIPVRALEGYRRAASLVGSADPACHIDWSLVGAIGRVESNHARFGGNHLDAAGVAQPGIIGIALDGSRGTARITDSEDGLWDGDSVFDRAVGPMQFIPSTWRAVGVDADGDGVKNPQDMTDAATATAVYLCSGPGDLNRPADLYGAILRYNASDSYARLVTAIADAYRHGVRALPAADLEPVGSAPPAGVLAATPGSPAGIAPSSGPVPSIPVASTPTVPTTTQTVPSPTVPPTTVPPTTVPPTTVPPTTTPDPTAPPATAPPTTVPPTTVPDPTTAAPPTSTPTA